MKSDKYGQLIFTELDLMDIYMTDPERSAKKALVSSSISFDEILQLTSSPELLEYTELDKNISTFDEEKQNIWFFPEEYKNFDIAKFVLDQCKNDAELQRTGTELLMFQERGMFMLLKYLKYLVDTMRKNNIVWGVGRGSSVASFVLYLIGVHRINSLYYDLSIDEFLK